MTDQREDAQGRESWSIVALRKELGRFEDELREAGLAESSIRTYVDRSDTFLRWLVGEYRPQGAFPRLPKALDSPSRAVRVARASYGVRVFQDEDRRYLAWLNEHPTGFVLNTYRSPTPSYLRLHRSTCWTISGTPARGRRWTDDYIKVCSDDAAAITKWAREEIGGEPVPCSHCAP